MKTFLQSLGEYTAISLFTVNNVTVTVGGLLAIFLVGIVTWLVSRSVDRLMNRYFIAVRKNAKGAVEQGRVRSLAQLTRYSVYCIGVVTGLHMVGLNMSSLLAAGAVFGVAIGFATQTILQNFMSGIIIMVENSVHPGDILEIDGEVVKVEEIRIRSTVVRNLRDEQKIVPNSNLVQNTVTNLTMTDTRYRLTVKVGVSYLSDLEIAKVAFAKAASQFSEENTVQLTEFADSSINFIIGVWIQTPWERNAIKSELLFAIFEELNAAKIEIPFPQIDVHIDREPALENKP